VSLITSSHHGDLKGFRLAAAQDFHGNVLTYYIAIERRKEIIGVADGLSVDRHDDIADQQTAFLSLAFLFKAT